MSIINTGRVFLTADDFVKIQLQPFNVLFGHFDKWAWLFFFIIIALIDCNALRVLSLMYKTSKYIWYTEVGHLYEHSTWHVYLGLRISFLNFLKHFFLKNEWNMTVKGLTLMWRLKKKNLIGVSLSSWRF